MSFHWNCPICPETRSGASYFQRQVAVLARASGLTLIGHGHPRILATLGRWYRTQGIEVVSTFEEVCRRADLYLNDASSTLFEFASTGRPVLVLNAPIYRRNVNHGLRFWEAATVGIQTTPQNNLVDAVHRALG